MTGRPFDVILYIKTKIKVVETHVLRRPPKERCSVVRLFRLENILTIAIIAAALGVSRILLQRKSYRLHGILLRIRLLHNAVRNRAMAAGTLP